MKDKRLNVKWANKVLRAKHFVVLTDTESYIAMEGMDPNSMDDMLVLQAQQASIDQFMDALKTLNDQHKKRIQRLGGKVGITRSKSTKKSTKKSA